MILVTSYIFVLVFSTGFIWLENNLETLFFLWDRLLKFEKLFFLQWASRLFGRPVFLWETVKKGISVSIIFYIAKAFCYEKLLVVYIKSFELLEVNSLLFWRNLPDAPFYFSRVYLYFLSFASFFLPYI